jgi:hypothetical protein
MKQEKENQDNEESSGVKAQTEQTQGGNPKKPLSSQDKMLEALAKGCSRKAAAAAGDMTAVELDRLLADDPVLARKARLARGKAEYELLTAIWKHTDWRAKTWLLEHWVAAAAQEEGEGFDDDERVRDDLSYRRLREDLAQSAGRPAVEGAALGRTAGGPGDVAGPADSPPA